MSSALSSPFQQDSIAEVVPDVAKVAGKLASSSVITGRRRVRLVPQSGQNYSSGNSAGVVNILIQDGQAYADLLSATLSFTLQTYDAGTATVGTSIVVPDDGAYSVFRRCLVSVNSTLMDDTDFLAKKVNAELYSTVSQDWYNSVGSWMGLWTANTTNYGYLAPTTNADPVFATKYNVLAKAKEVARRVMNSTTHDTTGVAQIPGQNKFSVPVSLLSSFFRNDTLFPSRNAGQLYLQLNLAQAVEACWNANNTASVTPAFQVSGLTLELDYVDLHPTYLEMMDSLIEAPGGQGINWAFDAHMVATQNINSGSGQQSVIVSKASQNLRSLQVLCQPQGGMSSGVYPSQSCFPNPGLIDIQYRIGSLYYPAFTAIGENRAYMDLQNAFGSPESIDKCGIIDNWNYYLTSSSTYATAVTGNNAGTAQSLTTVASPGSAFGIADFQKSKWADKWSYAYCFDRLKHAKHHGIDLDGVNTLTSAGSQMVVQLNGNPVESSVIVAIVRFTRVLHLGGGATSVIG